MYRGTDPSELDPDRPDRPELRAEALKGVNEERWEPAHKVRKLEKDLKELKELEAELPKLQQRLARLETKTKQQTTRRWWPVYVALGVALVFTALLVYYGRADAPEVSITYNVGEIIAGLLGGIGVGAAGTAYAVKTLRETKEEETEGEE